jgi:hypothetical protein
MTSLLDPIPKFTLHRNYFACNQCRDYPQDEPVQWCMHVKDAIHNGFDAEFLHPGITVNVPVMPESMIWVEVHIEPQELAPGVAPMQMLYKPEFGNLKKIDIGLWNTGEGLWVMRTCIVDYIRAKIDPDEKVTKAVPIVTPCPSSTHNLAARRWMANISVNTAEKWTCLWNIVMEGACTFCVKATTDPTNSGLGNKPPPAPWQGGT